MSKTKVKRPSKDWARKAIDGMTPAEVRHWCERLGVRVSDTRSPIERMIDEATGAAPGPERKRKRGKK